MQSSGTSSVSYYKLCPFTSVGQSWLHAADSMSQALGLETAPAGKPLLWRGAGHPRMPRFLQLCQLLRELQALCGISRWAFKRI
jgi:hypothetical protein